MPDRIESPPTPPPNLWGIRYPNGIWNASLFRDEPKPGTLGSGGVAVRLVPAGSEVAAVLGVLRERHRVVVDEWANADNRTTFGNAALERARIEDAMDLLNQLDEEGR